MSLRWSGNDAFDKSGRRVATVLRVMDLAFGVEVFNWTKQHWVAFVFHEYVLVDDEPGRWKTAAEAKAAAETTYAELLAAGHPGPPEEPPPSKRRGFVASLVHGWRDGRR